MAIESIVDRFSFPADLTCIPQVETENLGFLENEKIRILTLITAAQQRL
jgi:hypothetical protein